MKILKRIGLAFVRLVQSAWWLPQTSFQAVKFRQQWMRVHQLETERLRGLCQPEKSLGK
jgi:hypothetical protein